MREFYCYQAFNKFKTCSLETGDTQTDPENRKCVAGKDIRTVKGRCNVAITVRFFFNLKNDMSMTLLSNLKEFCVLKKKIVSRSR